MCAERDAGLRKMVLHRREICPAPHARRAECASRKFFKPDWSCVFFFSGQTVDAPQESGLNYDECVSEIVQYLFNQLMHPDGWDSKSGRGPNMRGTDAEGIARTRLEAEGYSYIDRQVTASEGGQVRIYDLLMSAPDGRNVAVEVKSTIGDVLKLNQAQVNFDAQVYERGATILTPSMANAVTVRQVMYIGVDFGSSAAAAFSSFRLKQILESSGASTQIYRSGRP